MPARPRPHLMLRRIPQLFALVALLVLRAPAVSAQTDGGPVAPADPNAATAAGAPAPADAAAVAAGEKLFKANCTSCHAVNRKVIGPALAGVTARRDESWIINFVHNSQAVIQSGDPYAVALYNEYNQTLMTAFPQLAEDDIRNILRYIEAEAAKAANAPTGGSAEAGATGGGAGIDSRPLYIGLSILIGVLVLIILALLLVVALLINAVRAREQKEGYTAKDVGQTFGQLARNKYVITSAVLLIAIVGTTASVRQARGIGLHQGYAPIQPVAFSHKLHAGQYGINCNYCHVGAERGKSATIPAVNICMNCHNYIQQGPRYGEREIGKVRAAYESGEPIEWVRIHNLQDFVYFNHAQHTVAGQIQCQQCHGEIQTMEVVYQFSDLSMGWCINCHRNTNVNLQNGYYQQTRPDLLNLGKEQDVKVEMIGGLECSKCHY